MDIINKNLTIVTGLWNIDKPSRSFDNYVECFNKILDMPNYMFIYIPEEYEHLVWSKRSRENTYVKIAGLDYVRKMYDPFWDRTQKIRTDPNWYNLSGENGWLKNSPQCVLEYYNPIVQSKMFFLNDATLYNPFDNDYFIWLDGGITNTVYEKYLTDDRVFDKINPYLEQFLFLSYPYFANNEIHGFKFKDMIRYSEDNVNYVCRGGLFGGRKDYIHKANASYYNLLSQTLDDGLMGTEESLFTILSYREPNIYRRYELDGNGLIVKFISELLDDKIELAPISTNKKPSVEEIETVKTPADYKTNLYILTFNFPEQLQYIIDCMSKVPEWLEKPKLYVLDNSTNDDARIQNEAIAGNYNFEYISLGGNTGICGGRQFAAEHFHNSDADFMFFFEDDMTINSNELSGQFCRNGFRKYIPNLYDIVHKIMIRDKLDFLKLTFTEVYFDNDKQCSWYNVPQDVRTKFWPHYDKLPVNGLDPNVPLTEFKNIRTLDGVSYIDGEVYYANWPMIVGKEGNKKMFMETKWARPFEQTWMSHNFQLTKEGKLKPAVLLCSPIWHNRIKHYTPQERREN